MCGGANHQTQMIMGMMIIKWQICNWAKSFNNQLTEKIEHHLLLRQKSSKLDDNGYDDNYVSVMP